ncbi:MAG: putative porin [Woeseia sp.]
MSIRLRPLAACIVCLAAPVQALCAEPANGWWAERISMSGDLRLRYESIRWNPGTDVERERYRGRLGVTLAASDALEIGVRLATGEGSPVSTNLDFGESFTFDDIRIDRAYVAWSANESLELVGGKMKNPLFRSGENTLMWDNDLNPEGIAAKVESGVFFGTAGGFILDDRNDGVESWLYAAQAGARFGQPDSSILTAGIGWFDYSDIQGNSSLFGDDAQGNSVDAAGNYLHDYDVMQVFAQYESAVAGRPVTFFADWARNSRVAIANTAWSVGVNFGKAEEAGTMEFSWSWRDTEADALMGIFTDSDIADGHTDSRGHLLQALYKVNEHAGIAATLIFSEYGQFTDASTDFDRLMLDIEFSF